MRSSDLLLDRARYIYTAQVRAETIVLDPVQGTVEASSLEEGKVYLAWLAIGPRLKIFGTLAHLNALS